MTNDIIKHAEDTMSFLNADISDATTNRLLEFESHVKNIGLENNFKYYTSNFSLTDKNNANLLLIRLNNGLQNIFSSISIYDTKGLKLASHNNSNNWFDPGLDISNEDIFKNSFKDNSFHDMHLLYSPLSKDYFVILSAPVYGLEGNDIHTKSSNKIDGIVVASYPVSALLEDILSHYIIKENNLYLLSNDGTIIYSTHINQLKTHISLSNPSNQTIGSKFTDEPIYNQIAASSRLIESGIYPPFDNSVSSNSLYVAVKDAINNDTESYNLGDSNKGNLFNDFILISELDAGTAFKDMFNLRSVFVITTFVIFIGVTIAALHASKSITRPLIRLKDSAISITKGNLNDVIHPTSDDEIGELATQFEKMRQSITQYIDDILKKDKELEKANKELIEV
ncbi:MAG: HAMP domain-containing protein, partial [Nitrosopumilus sp.]|nr:HAMP domain-containing protein [Nitrosopumilus sp.]